MVKCTYLIKRLITPNHVSLQCSWLYTLTSIFLYATPQQILVLRSKSVLWERGNIGHSLRQSIIIIIII
jgi:hypothetical protein